MIIIIFGTLNSNLKAELHLSKLRVYHYLFTVGRFQILPPWGHQLLAATRSWSRTSGFDERFTNTIVDFYISDRVSNILLLEFI